MYKALDKVQDSNKYTWCRYEDNTETAAVTASVDFKPNGPRSEAINLDPPCKQFLIGHPRLGVISYTMAEMYLVID